MEGNPECDARREASIVENEMRLGRKYYYSRRYAKLIMNDVPEDFARKEAAIVGKEGEKRRSSYLEAIRYAKLILAGKSEEARKEVKLLRKS